MSVQLTAGPTAGSRRHTTANGPAAPRTGGTVAGTTRTAGVRRRALLVALGLALAAAVLPAAAAHASPQPPDIDNQLTNPAGNPQPPEPPDPPRWGPEDLANPTEDPEPPLPPDPPEVPDWGPDDLANPTEDPDPPLPPPPPDPVDGDSIPTPERVDAGLGGTAAGPDQAAGLALIGAALVLALLVIVIARRHRAEARSTR